MRLLSFLFRRRIAFALVPVVLAAPAWARDSDLDRATLNGIPAVQVVVAPVNPDAERDGLTRSQLQTDVESRLRQAGIRVDSSAQGRLSVEINTEKETGYSIYVFNIAVALLQSVNLARDPMIIHPAATTWSASFGGIIGSAYLYQVRSAVIDLVDRFINAYLEQNPKQ